jgi:hypothetical protein
LDGTERSSEQANACNSFLFFSVLISLHLFPFRIFYGVLIYSGFGFLGRRVESQRVKMDDIRPVHGMGEPGRVQ